MTLARSWRTSDYRRLVLQSGVGRIAAWSLLGRLTFAMTNLSLLLYVHATTGQLAVAGAAAATNLVGSGCVAVMQGRWFDRWGVGRTLRGLTAVYVPLTAAMVVLIESHPPLWLLLPVTLAHGTSMPLMGVATRTIVPHLAPAGPLRDAALRYWTISFEICYVLAPALAAGLAASVWAGAGFLCSTLGLAVASISYAALPTTRQHRGTSTQPVTADQSRNPAKGHSRAGLHTLAIAAFGFGTAVGFIVITTTAMTITLGEPHAVGLLFALMTLCSVGGGILFGVRAWPRRIALQLPFLLLVSACALLIPLTGGHMAALAICVAVAGVTFAPQLMAQSLICDRIVARQHIGAGWGWLAAAVAVGNAGGQAVGGALSQLVNPHAAAAVGALTIAAAAAVIMARRTSLEPQPTLSRTSSAV